MFLKSLEIKWFTAFNISDMQVELMLVDGGRLHISVNFVQDLRIVHKYSTFYAKQKLFRLLIIESFLSGIKVDFISV